MHIVADRVKETTTTTGTGDLTLAGAITGFLPFSARCSDGDTLYYSIQAVDGATGVPTGEWECGRGTYSAADTLTRDVVLSSSNSDALVSFAAGDKQVYLTMTAAQVSLVKDPVAQDITYFVRTDGADTNDGLADTAGGAFLTIGKALSMVNGRHVMGFATAYIQIAPGTYDAPVEQITRYGDGRFELVGSGTNIDDVVVEQTGASLACFTVNGGSGYPVKFSNMKLLTTQATNGIEVIDGGSVLFGAIEFGECLTHIMVDGGSTVTIETDYSVSGDATTHILLKNRSCLTGGGTADVTITGAPNIDTWLKMETLSIADLSDMAITYTGAVTGTTRYSVTQNSVCIGAGTLPGTGGSTASGGQYI